MTARRALPSRKNRGASIVIALVFMLICTLVSTVIVYLASANAERARAQATDVQSYEALSSASRLSCDVFSKDSELAALTMTVSASGQQPSWNSTGTTALAAWVREQATNVYLGKATTPLSDVAITATNPTSGQALPDALATYSMGSDYTITVAVRLRDQSAYAYTISSKVSPRRTGITVDSSGNLTYSYPLSVTWGGASS